MSEGLSRKHRRFVAEYIKDPSNQAEAAIRVGYSAKSAYSQASRLLKNDKIRAAVEEGLAAIERAAIATAGKVLIEATGIALSDVTQLFNADGSLKKMNEIPESMRRAISSVEVVEMEGGAAIGGEAGIKHVPMFTKKIKFWDKIGALNLLAKHHKLLTDVVELKVADLAKDVAEGRQRILDDERRRRESGKS